jgi:BirA family biotin operon repressor/biotin-[acetyl-CoA-carboxylase] ligase
LSNNFPSGYERVVLSEIDSTNAFAAREYASMNGPTWVLGLRQTAGRGRRGRAWADPVGNFAGTLVLFPRNETPDRLALRSFVAALALYDACSVVVGQSAPFTLKWPNDVLLNGSKVAGILLETIAIGRGDYALAIGIGVNLAHAPNAADLPDDAVVPVSLADQTGVLIDPETFLTHLAQSYAHFEQQFQTHGFSPIRTAWLARAAKLGEQIIARTQKYETRGIFDTIDEQGQLILSTQDGQRAIAAADIYF